MKTLKIYPSVEEQIKDMLDNGFSQQYYLVPGHTHHGFIVRALSCFWTQYTGEDNFPGCFFRKFGCIITATKGTDSWDKEFLVFKTKRYYDSFLLAWG